MKWPECWKIINVAVQVTQNGKCVVQREVGLGTKPLYRWLGSEYETARKCDSSQGRLLK